LTVVSPTNPTAPSSSSNRTGIRRSTVQGSTVRRRNPLHLVRHRRRRQGVREAAVARVRFTQDPVNMGTGDHRRVRRHLRQPDPDRQPELERVQAAVGGVLGGPAPGFSSSDRSRPLTQALNGCVLRVRLID
jgi:hypothetical protein